MALRRSIWSRMGGFDPALGPGAEFFAGDDTDMALRCLQAGIAVCETPATHVVHLGFRSWPDRRRLITGYMIGLGALYAKHLKCGRWSALMPMLCLAMRWAVGHPVVALGPKPGRLFRLRAFLKGFGRGLAHPVDRAAAQFRAGAKATPADAVEVV
jgi:GT2 family glycosyltransferase